MKHFLFPALILLNLGAYAHKPVKVQTLEEAIAKYTTATLNFSEFAVAETATYLKEAESAQANELTFVKFRVKGDWGPIHGLAVFHANGVHAMEILVYTEHEGAGITHPVFLDQFKNLTRDNYLTESIKPLPKEPKASLALQEVVAAVFKMQI